MRCEECGCQQDTGRWCGQCGSLLPAKITSEGEAVRAEGAADKAAADGDAADASILRYGVTAATRGNARGLAAAAMLAVLATAVALVSPWSSDGAEHATPQSTGKPEDAAQEPTGRPERARPAPAGRAEELPPEPIAHDHLPFDEPTGTALIFDAGGEAAVVLDVDTGSTTRFRLPRGNTAPSEQPYPLLRRGEWLVVVPHGGWALAPGAESDLTTRSLGDGEFAIPAAEPGQAWLVDDDGDGQGEATWTLVEATGAVVAQVHADEGYTPIRGVPAGLAVRDQEGAVLVYDIGAAGFRPFLEDGTRILDVAADHVITCSEPCEELAVRDEGGEVIGRLGTEGVRGHGLGWLSPDGRLLAASAFVFVDGGEAVGREIRIYDVDKGELLDRAPIATGGLAGSWSPDSEQFFYRTMTAGPSAKLGRYAVGEARFEVASLDAQDAPLRGFVAVSRELLGPLLGENRDGR